MAEANAHAAVDRPQFQPVGDDVLDQLAVDLANALRIKTLEADLEAGKMILDRCYLGNFALFNAHNTGDQSIVKIAERMPQLGYPLGRTQLTRYVKMYEQELTFGPLSRWRNLTATHLWLAQVLDLNDQPAALQDADEKSLSLEQFTEVLRRRAGGRRIPEPTALDNVYRRVSTLLGELHHQEEWLNELRQGHLQEDEIELFEGLCERITIEIESAILMLADHGAQVPKSRVNALRKHIEGYASRAAQTAGQLLGANTR